MSKKPINSLDLVDIASKERSNMEGFNKNFTPVKKEYDISNATQAEEAEKPEYDTFASGVGKWFTNMAGTIITSTADLVGGVLDVGDWHHTLDALEDVPYLGKAIKYGTPIGWLSGLSKIIDNTIGDGEDYVGNWIMDNSITNAIDDYIEQNQINTGSSWDWLLNGSASVIGSGISFGGGFKLVGSGVMKGLGAATRNFNKVSSKLGYIAKPTARTQRMAASAVTSGLMTQSISAMLGKETYDTVYNDMLNEAGFGEGKETAYKGAYEKFMAANKGKIPDDQLVDEATKFAQKSSAEWEQNWLNANQGYVDEAKKAAINGADATMKINAASFAFNLTGSMLALRGMTAGATRGAATNATRFGFFQKDGIKDLAVEVGQEFIEEGIIENYASAKGIAVGKGEDYGIMSDFAKDFLSTETLKTAALTALGTSATVGATNALTYKGRKEAADKAQKAVDDFARRLPTSGGQDILSQTASLKNSYEQIAQIAEEVENLKKQGRNAEAEELNNSIVSVQAMQAFKTGTTDKLIEQYQAIANNENFDIDVRKKAQDIAGEVKQFEDLYNNLTNKGYANVDSLFYNRVNSYYLEKGDKELKTKIAEQKTKAWADVLANETNLPTKKVSNVEANKKLADEFDSKEKELQYKLAESTQDSRDQINKLQDQNFENDKEIDSLNQENNSLRKEEKSLREKLADLVSELLDLGVEDDTKRKSLESQQKVIETQISDNQKKQDQNILYIDKLEKSITTNDNRIKRQKTQIAKVEKDTKDEITRLEEELRPEALPDDETEITVSSISDITDGKDFELETERQQFSKYREGARKLESVRDLEVLIANQDLFKQKKALLDKDYNEFTSKKNQLNLYFQNEFTQELKNYSSKIKESIAEDNDDYIPLIDSLAKKYENKIDKEALETIKAKYIEMLEESRKNVANLKKEENENLALEEGGDVDEMSEFDMLMNNSLSQDVDETTSESDKESYEQKQNEKLQGALKEKTDQDEGLASQINEFLGSPEIEADVNNLAEGMQPATKMPVVEEQQQEVQGATRKEKIKTLKQKFKEQTSPIKAYVPSNDPLMEKLVKQNVNDPGLVATFSKSEKEYLQKNRSEILRRREQYLKALIKEGVEKQVRNTTDFSKLPDFYDEKTKTKLSGVQLSNNSKVELTVPGEFIIAAYEVLEPNSKGEYTFEEKSTGVEYKLPLSYIKKITVGGVVVYDSALAKETDEEKEVPLAAAPDPTEAPVDLSPKSKNTLFNTIFNAISTKNNSEPNFEMFIEQFIAAAGLDRVKSGFDSIKDLWLKNKGEANFNEVFDKYFGIEKNIDELLSLIEEEGQEQTKELSDDKVEIDPQEILNQKKQGKKIAGTEIIYDENTTPSGNSVQITFVNSRTDENGVQSFEKGDDTPGAFFLLDNDSYQPGETLTIEPFPQSKLDDFNIQVFGIESEEKALEDLQQNDTITEAEGETITFGEFSKTVSKDDKQYWEKIPIAVKDKDGNIVAIIGDPSAGKRIKPGSAFFNPNRVNNVSKINNIRKQLRQQYLDGKPTSLTAKVTKKTPGDTNTSRQLAQQENQKYPVSDFDGALIGFMNDNGSIDARDENGKKITIPRDQINAPTDSDIYNKRNAIMLVKSAAKTEDGKPIYSVAIASAGNFNDNQQSTARNLLLFYMFYNTDTRVKEAYDAFATEYNKKSSKKIPLSKQFEEIIIAARNAGISLDLKTGANETFIKEFFDRMTIVIKPSIKKDNKNPKIKSNFELAITQAKQGGVPYVSNNNGKSGMAFGISEDGNQVGELGGKKGQVFIGKAAYVIKKALDNNQDVNSVFENLFKGLDSISEKVLPKLQVNRSKKIIKEGEDNFRMFEITQTLNADGTVKLNFRLTDTSNAGFIKRNSTVGYKPLKFTNKDGKEVTTMVTNPSIEVEVTGAAVKTVQQQSSKQRLDNTSKTPVSDEIKTIKEEAKVEKQNQGATKQDIEAADDSKKEQLQSESKKIDEEANKKIENVKNEKLDDIKKQWDSSLSMLNEIKMDDGTTKILMLSPKKISEEGARSVVQEVNRYYGIQPQHFDSLVTYAFSEITIYKNKNKGKVLSGSDIDNEISKIFDNAVDSRIKLYQKQIAEVNELIDNEAEKKNYIDKFNYLIDYIENIKKQKQNIVKAALEKTNLKLTTPEAFNEENKEENEVEKIYSKSFLEEGGKLSISKELKEFLTGIPKVDANGNQETGFLNLPSFVPIDEVVGTIQQLLADAGSSYNNQLEILSKSQEAHPFLKEVIAKLSKADKKTQNLFSSFFDKSQLKMKFILFGSEGNKSFVKVMDTNANTIEKIILKNWNTNLKQSALIGKNANGQFIYEDVEEAKDKIENFYKSEDKITINTSLTRKLKNVESQLVRNNKVDRTKLQQALNSEKNIKSAIKKGSINSFELAGQTFFVNENGTLLSKAPKTSLFERLRLNVDIDNSINEFMSLLSEFGINISKGTVEELISPDKGIWVKSEARFVKFNESFGEKSAISFFKIIKDSLVNVQGGSLLEGNNFLDQTIFKSLAGLEVKFTDSIAPTSFRDDQKLLQGYINKTYVKEREAALKAEDDTVRNNLLKQAFSKRSMLLDLLSNNKIRESFEVDYLGLTSLKLRGQRAYQSTQLQNLTDADHEFEKLSFYSDMKLGAANVSYQGIETRQAGFFALTMSDKSTMTPIFMPTLDFKANDFEVTANDIQPGSNMIDILYGQAVLPELERMLSNLGGDIKGYNKGKDMFLLFPEINNIRVKYKGEEKTIQEFISIVGKDKVKEYLDNNNTNSEHVAYLNKFTTEAKKVLKDTVNKLNKEKLANWAKYGIVNEVSTGDVASYTNNRVDSDFLNKFDPNNKQLSENNKISFASIEFIVNNIISNANQFMLIAGDPAMYYKSPKDNNSFTAISKETSLNISKRLAAMIAPGVKLANSEGDSYIQIFVNDNESPANNLKTLVKLLDGKSFDENEFKELRSKRNESSVGKTKYKSFISQYPNSAAYFDIESTDAQEYTTWEEHLNVLERLGKNQPGLIDSAKLEDSKKLIESGKPIKDMTADEKEILKFVFQPIKPVYTGQIKDPNSTNNETLYRTVYIKSSSIPLIPQITEGTQLDVIRKAMEKYQNKQGSKVRLSFNTANKVGTFANTMSIFDDNGNIMQQDVDTLMQQFDSSSLVLDRNNFRIQQDVPYKGEKETVSQGTQTTKILFGNGVTEMDGFQYNGESINGSELEREFFNNYSNLIDLEKEILYNELGIDVNTNTPKNYKFTANKLKRLLVKEAKERNYDQQVIDSFNIKYTRDNNGQINGYEFSFPLWLSPSSNRIESLLNSIVTNRIAKIKLPGSSYVVSSPEGYKKLAADQLDQDIKNQIIYVNEDFDGELKGLEINDDSSIKHKTQVYLPSRFKTADGELLDLFKRGADGNYIYVKETPSGFVLNKDMFDEELLSNISFRIPTSSHQSMLDVEIVGFLPPRAGDLMVVPRNTLTQVGLDFDIDKQTNYHLYHTIDENGKVVVLTGDVDQIKNNIKTLEEEVAFKEELLEAYKTDIKQAISEAKDLKTQVNDLKEEQEEEINALYTNWLTSKEEVLGLELLIEVLEDEVNTTEDQVVDNLISAMFPGITIEELEAVRAETVAELENNKLLLEKAKEERDEIRKELDEKSEGKIKLPELIKLTEEIDKLYADRKERNKVDIKSIKAEKIVLDKAREQLGKLYKNNIVKVHSSVLSNPKMQSKISKALSMDWAKKQGKYISDLVESSNRVEKEKNSMASFTMLSDSYQKDLVTLGAAGKTGIGSYSIDVVFHSLMQQNEANFFHDLPTDINFGSIESGYKFGEINTIVPNKIDFYINKLRGIKNDPRSEQIISLLQASQQSSIELGTQLISTMFPNITDEYSKLGREISDVLTERQNLATDNAKEQVLEKLFLNEETFDVDKVLTLLGFDKDENGKSIVGLFLNQPIIRDYVAAIQNSSSVISDFVADKEQDAMDKVMEKYNISQETLKKYNPATATTEFERSKILGNIKNAWKNISGSTLEKQIKDRGNDAEYQYLALQRFQYLSIEGKKLRKIQALLNVDSQGLGKSFFDVIAKKQSFESLFLNSDGTLKDYESQFLSLFGRVNMNKTASQLNADDILIRKFSDNGNVIYFTPTTIAGKMIAETVYPAYELWSEHFPYDKGEVGRAINQIISTRGVSPDNPFQYIEAGQKALQEINKLINSYNYGTFSEDNVSAERVRLFTEQGGDSLAKYLNNLKLSNYDAKFEQVVKSIVLNNALIKSLEYEIDNDNGLSLVKYNNATGEDIEKGRLYNAIPNLIQYDLPLPDFNGETYTTRMLAQDLVNYSLIEGGVQEAIQFSKHVPLAYLLNTDFISQEEIKYELRNATYRNEVAKDDFGDSIYGPSPFELQYFQHNFSQLPNLAKNNVLELKDGILTTKDNLTKTMYKYKDSNGDIFPYYRIGLNKYKRADKLNTFGTNEYDINQTGAIETISVKKEKQKSNTASNLSEQKDIADAIAYNNETGMSDAEILQAIMEANAAEQSSVLNKKFFLNESNLSKSLRAIADADLGNLSALAKILNSVMPDNINLVIGSSAGDGEFSNNTITLNSDFVKNTSNQNELARVLVHEAIHAVTSSTMDKYVDINADGSAKEKPGVENVPKEVTNLIRIFNRARKEFEKKHPGKIQQATGKTSLTEAQLNVDYGFTNIKEFLTLLATSNEFVKTLADLPYDKGTSMLEKLTQALSDLFTFLRKNIGLETNSELVNDSLQNMFKVIEKQTGTQITFSNKENDLIDKVDKELDKNKDIVKSKAYKITIKNNEYDIVNPLSSDAKVYDTEGKLITDEETRLKVMLKALANIDREDYNKRLKKANELSKHNNLLSLIISSADYGIFKLSDSQYVFINSTGSPKYSIPKLNDSTKQQLDKIFNGNIKSLADTLSGDSTPEMDINSMANIFGTAASADALSSAMTIVSKTLDTEKEKFAQKQGFSDWGHVVNSMNKRLREQGKEKMPFNIETFNSLSNQEILDLASKSKSAQSKEPSIRLTPVEPTTQTQAKKAEIEKRREISLLAELSEEEVTELWDFQDENPTLAAESIGGTSKTYYEAYYYPNNNRNVEISSTDELSKEDSKDINKVRAWVNAKYDAELAALETKITQPTQQTSEFPTTTIISGGQTGVDQIGLEVGKGLGMTTGGTAPIGFQTEKGKDISLAEKYGMKEITAEEQNIYAKGKTDAYTARTEMNALNSDGTVYFATNADSAGRIATERYAKKHNKPFILNPTAEQLKKFLADNNIKTLNVAGNRGSKLTAQQKTNIKNILTTALKTTTQPQVEKSNIEIDQQIIKDNLLKGSFYYYATEAAYSKAETDEGKGATKITKDNVDDALKRLKENEQVIIDEKKFVVYEDELNVFKINNTEFLNFNDLETLLNREKDLKFYTEEEIKSFKDKFNELKGIQQDDLSPRRITPVTNTIRVPEYTTADLKNKDGSKRFASARGTNIIINPVVNTNELFDYMQGKEGGITSMQKQLVLDKLESRGYSLERLKLIIDTPQKANLFLILHEQDHILHNDRDVYWRMGRDLLTPDKINIETRATINALKKLEKEFGVRTVYDEELLSIEQQSGLRNEDGTRKKFIKKSYKSTLKRTIALNKANPKYKFRIITVEGEKGDKYRVYDAISASMRSDLSPKKIVTKQIENSVISGANKKQIEDIINDFENTCR